VRALPTGPDGDDTAACDATVPFEAGTWLAPELSNGPWPLMGRTVARASPGRLTRAEPGPQRRSRDVEHPCDRTDAVERPAAHRRPPTGRSPRHQRAILQNLFKM